ncbi:MAG: hypothetical protein GEV08_02550 [Acidimicrobiia bacterium]|nr:hypothetical protein [Acidimicrobiia bacterium]
MTSSRVTVLVVHPRADEVVRRALEGLERLAVARLIRPLWVVDAGDGPQPTLRCWRVGADGPQEGGPLLDRLAEQHRVEVAHVVTVASSALPLSDVPALAGAAIHVTDQLERHRPPSAVVVEARVLALTDLDRPTPLVELFTPRAQANVVLLPEDRPSDEAFSMPLSAERPEVFAGHVAVGVATQAGLWQGMPEAPIEDGAPGVTGSGDAKVMVARSFARVAVGPPLPVDEALTSMRPLPVPPGCDVSYNPSRDVTRWADAVLARLPGLRFEQPPARPDEREAVDVRTAAGRIGRETGRYLAGIPRQLRTSVLSDLEHLAGESINAAIGEDAKLTTVWAGMDPAPGSQTSGPGTVAEFESAVAHRREEIDGSRVSRAEWGELVDNALALVDGGPAPAVAPPTEEGRRLVVSDPTVFGPDPSSGAAAVRQQLTSGDDGGETLLGRVASSVRAQWQAAEGAATAAMADFRRAREVLDRRPSPLLGALNWVMATLFVGLVATGAVLSGLAEAAGLLEWDEDQRTVAWLALSGVALMSALACAVPVLKGPRVGGQSILGKARVELGVLFGVLVLLAAAAQDAVVLAPPPIGAVRVGEVLLTSLFGAALLALAALCHGRGGRRGPTAAKAVGAILLVHVTLSGVGGVVRQNSWYADMSSGDRRQQLLLWAGGLLVAVLATLVTIAWLRVGERLRLGGAAARLRWAEQAALSCAGQAERLGIAHGQLVATATALNRLVWLPFGPPVTAEDRRAPELEELAGAMSLRISRFELSEHGRDALLARIRREVAKPGWLQHQYGAAVELFRPELAHRTGRDVETLAHLHPERDPSIEPSEDAPGHGPESSRWALARMLHEGTFDRALRERVSDVASGQVFGLYFERDDRQRGGDEALETIQELGGELVRGRAPQLPASFFRRMPLPVADDPRARFCPRVWWPSKVVPAPQGLPDVAVHESEPVDAGAAGLILAFVRSDWTMPFASSDLPLSEFPAPAVATNGHAPFDEHVM